MLFNALRRSTLALGLAASPLLATAAHAGDGWIDDAPPPPERNDLDELDRVRVALDGWNPLYVGHGNHVRISTGFGMAFGDGTTGFGVQPALSGRFKINEQFGVLLDIPFAYGNLSADGGGSVSRFEIGNISAAVEYTLDEMTSSFSRVRFGLTAPTMAAAEASIFDLEDIVAQGNNVRLATGASGLMDLWRYAPDTLALTAEFLAESGVDDVYLELGAGLALLIPIGENDFEMALQTRFRMGFGENVIGFGGLTMVIIPTEIGDGDGFQLGLQAGGIFKLGKARLDAFVQLNLDNPAGFSFSDEGVFGVHLAATVPF